MYVDLLKCRERKQASDLGGEDNLAIISTELIQKKEEKEALLITQKYMRSVDLGVRRSADV